MNLNQYRDLVKKVAEHIGLPLLGDFAGVDMVWTILEKMRMEGAVVLLKLDGERGRGDSGPYTALVSGKPLQGDFFRTDADSMEDALAYIIVSYARQCWNFSE